VSLRGPYTTRRSESTRCSASSDRFPGCDSSRRGTAISRKRPYTEIPPENASRRPDLIPGGITEDDGGRASVDRLAEQLIARRPAGDEKPEDRILARYLGIEPEDAPAWPHAGQWRIAFVWQDDGAHAVEIADYH